MKTAKAKNQCYFFLTFFSSSGKSGLPTYLLDLMKPVFSPCEKASFVPALQHQLEVNSKN